MTVVVEVAHQRRVHTHFVELLTNIRHCRRRFGRVDRDAHQLRARLCKGFDLQRRTERIRRVGIGHGLHDHGMITTDDDLMCAIAHDDFVRGVARLYTNLYTHFLLQTLDFCDRTATFSSGQ